MQLPHGKRSTLSHANPRQQALRAATKIRRAPPVSRIAGQKKGVRSDDHQWQAEPPRSKASKDTASIPLRFSPTLGYTKEKLPQNSRSVASTSRGRDLVGGVSWERGRGRPYYREWPASGGWLGGRASRWACLSDGHASPRGCGGVGVAGLCGGVGVFQLSAGLKRAGINIDPVTRRGPRRGACAVLRATKQEAVWSSSKKPGRGGRYEARGALELRRARGVFPPRDRPHCSGGEPKTDGAPLWRFTNKHLNKYLYGQGGNSLQRVSRSYTLQLWRAGAKCSCRVHV